MLEHGAYRLLLDYYYSKGGPFANDLANIYRACKAFTPTERRAVQKVLSKYFSPGDGVWRHPRADKEISKQKQVSENAREKANKRWNINMPGHLQQQCKPATSNQQPTKLAAKNGLYEEEHEDEILPSRWHDIAEERGIPDEQIYKSWRKFKDTTGLPFKLSRWTAWIAKERINAN